MDAISWLLESGAAIRWQTISVLTATSPAEVAAERERVASEGLAATILAHQTADGSWRRSEGSAWAPTLFSLLLLRATGVPHTDVAVESAIARLERLHWDESLGPWDLRPTTADSRSFFEGEVEPCINGGVLALGAYFGRPSSDLAGRLVAEQLEDGGWNCEAPTSSRSSFDTTICVLEGLLEYERANRSAREISAARKRGEEYLLERGLMRRRSNGELVDAKFLELAFPPRYHYDVLRALDYFRSTGAAPNPRLREAVAYVASRRRADGRWDLDRAYDETLPFPLDETVGTPSRWLTLRALRVLRWWHADRGDDGRYGNGKSDAAGASVSGEPFSGDPASTT